MIKTLRIFYTGEILAVLEWSINSTRIVTAVSSLQAEFQKFIAEGLSEWQGNDSDAKPVYTDSRDFYFLDRLANYLTRQFNYQYSISVT